MENTELEETNLPEETTTTGYTAEEIKALHKEGHHIGNPDHKLNATHNEHFEPTWQAC